MSVVMEEEIKQNLDSLQKDLDKWLHPYNYEQTHSGKMCCGMTLIETLEDGKALWQEKRLSETPVSSISETSTPILFQALKIQEVQH